jgi:hypothetical protein
MFMSRKSHLVVANARFVAYPKLCHGFGASVANNLEGIFGAVCGYYS